MQFSYWSIHKIELSISKPSGLFFWLVHILFFFYSVLFTVKTKQLNEQKSVEQYLQICICDRIEACGMFCMFALLE